VYACTPHQCRGALTHCARESLITNKGRVSDDYIELTGAPFRDIEKIVLFQILDGKPQCLQRLRSGFVRGGIKFNAEDANRWIASKFSQALKGLPQEHTPAVARIKDAIGL